MRARKLFIFDDAMSADDLKFQKSRQVTTEVHSLYIALSTASARD